MFLVSPSDTPHSSTITKSISEQVIGPNVLLSTKARILVTNSIAFLRHFDKIIYLRRGIVIESGSYSELMFDQGSNVSKLM